MSWLAVLPALGGCIFVTARVICLIDRDRRIERDPWFWLGLSAIAADLLILAFLISRSAT